MNKIEHIEHLVTSEWLVQQLDNPNIAIADCRFQLANPHWGEEEYLQGHIPGAFYLHLERDLSSPVQLHGGRHPLPDVNSLAQKLGQMGIVPNQTLVVAYDDSRFAFAARFWWLLRYLGHESVVLLDGGWQDWLHRNYPVSKNLPPEQPKKFIPQTHPEWLVDITQVRSIPQQPETILVDARDRDRYLGLVEPIDPVAGSIPGAVNSPWQQTSNNSGLFKSIQEQQQLWQDYNHAQEIVVYCGSGVTACVNLFSLNMAGFTNTKLYPGGWSDWCSYLDF